MTGRIVAGRVDSSLFSDGMTITFKMSRNSRLGGTMRCG